MSNWLGGPLFTKQKKYAAGKNNDGAQRRRLGLTKRGRFNSNPTMSESLSDPLRLKAVEDKKNFEKVGRPIRIFKSKI